jgi:hypothetical protein
MNYWADPVEPKEKSGGIVYQKERCHLISGENQNYRQFHRGPIGFKRSFPNQNLLFSEHLFSGSTFSISIIFCTRVEKEGWNNEVV